MFEAWFLALLRVGFVLLGAWGAGLVMTMPVRRTGIWESSVALTMGAGLALRMLLQSNAVLWAPWAVPWVDGLFVLAAGVGGYEVWRKVAEVVAGGFARTGVRASQGARAVSRNAFLLLLLWVMVAVFVATLRFPEYSDAYFRAHFLVIEDMAVDGFFDTLHWTLYYGYALGAMALFSAAAQVPVLYEQQIFHYAFLVLAILMLFDTGKRYGMSRRAAAIAGLLAVTIIEVVVITRNPGYDMVVHFFQLTAVFVLLDWRGRTPRLPEVLLLSLLMFAALSSKLYGAIGVGAAGLFALFLTRQYWRIPLAGVIALLLLVPAMAVIHGAYGSPLFPYVHDLYGGRCDGLTIPYEQSLWGFLRYPFELTLRFDSSRLMAGPAFLAVIPLLFTRRGRAVLSPPLRALLYYGLLCLALWYWLPFTSLSIRYQLFMFLLLTLPVAAYVDAVLTDNATVTSVAARAGTLDIGGRLLRWSVLVLVLVHVFPATWYSTKKVLDTFLELRIDPKDGSLLMLQRTYPWLVSIDRAIPEGATMYGDIGEYEPLRHRRSLGTFLKDRGQGVAQADYVVLLKEGTDSYISCMLLMLTDGHPERYEDWKDSIRTTREFVTTVEERYDIYR